MADKKKTPAKPAAKDKPKHKPISDNPAAALALLARARRGR